MNKQTDSKNDTVRERCNRPTSIKTDRQTDRCKQTDTDIVYECVAFILPHP